MPTSMYIDLWNVAHRLRRFEAETSGRANRIANAWWSVACLHDFRVRGDAMISQVFHNW